MSYLMNRYKNAEVAKGMRKDGEVMGRSSSVWVTALVFINAVLLCTCVAFYIIKENEIERRILLDRSLDDALMEAKNLTIELENMKTTVNEMELELALKKHEVRSLKEKFDLVVAQSKTIRSEDPAVTAELMSVQEDYDMLRGDYEDLQQSYDQLYQTKRELEDRLHDAMRSGVQLQTIVVEPDASSALPGREERFARAAASPKTVTGEILAVNREYEFLVVNLGMNSGITKDSDISIYKGSELVGMAKVEKLYDNISAVVVDDNRQLDRTKVGDTVVGTIE